MIIHLILIAVCSFLITLAGVSMTLFSDRDARGHWDIYETYAGMGLSLVFAVVYIFVRADDMGMGGELSNLVMVKLIAIAAVVTGAMLGAVYFAIWINRTWILKELGMSRAEWDALGDDSETKEKSKKDRDRKRRD